MSDGNADVVKTQKKAPLKRHKPVPATPSLATMISSTSVECPSEEEVDPAGDTTKTEKIDCSFEGRNSCRQGGRNGSATDAAGS